MQHFLKILMLSALLITLPYHLVLAQDAAQEETLKALDKALDKTLGVPSDSEKRRITSNTQQQAQKIDPELLDRIKTMEKKTQIEQTNVAAWTELGNLYFDTDQPKKAIPAYEMSLNLEPDNPNVNTDLGVMYRHVGKFDKALECFNKAIAASPGHVIASFNKSVVLEHDKNDRVAALAALKALAAKNPQAVLPGNRPVTKVIEELSQ